MSRRFAVGYLVVLCLAGAVRVFLGAASLPLFNDVDELAHFDLVGKYASGTWTTRTKPTLEPETVDITIFFSSFEYLSRAEDFPQGYPPPVWTMPAPLQISLYKKHAPEMKTRINHDAYSPPVYYALAGAWYNLARWVGLNEPHAVYAIRFLNVLLQVALIVAAFGFCRDYFSTAVAITVPAMVALFPSTVFFSISNDALCPLTVLLALWLLLRWSAKPTDTRLSIAAGLAVSIALLVKLTNIAILPVCLLVVALRLFPARRTKSLYREAYFAGLVMLFAVGPVALWMLQNRLTIGDWTGNAMKVQLLGWTAKPWTAIFDHPLFSWSGELAFWNRFCTSFYGGDMNWHGEPSMSPLPLKIFAWLSFACLPVGVAAIGIGAYRKQSTRPTGLAGLICPLLVAGSILFLFVMSVRFDFGHCPYPSREYPYFNSGRLISGALVPLLALFVCGVEAITGRVKGLTAIVLTLSVLVLVPPQVALWQQTVPCKANWFHLPLQLPNRQRMADDRRPLRVVVAASSSEDHERGRQDGRVK